MQAEIPDLSAKTSPATVIISVRLAFPTPIDIGFFFVELKSTARFRPVALADSIWDTDTMKMPHDRNGIRMARGLLVALVIPMALAACTGFDTPTRTTINSGNSSSKGEPGAPIQASFTRFPDLPMPVSADLQMDQTLIFGTNDTWIGRLVIHSSHSANDMFDFYKREMTGFDWQEITSVRSKTSVMTYTRGQRVATIQIEGRTLRGAAITITVSPRGAEEFPPSPTPAAPAS